MPDKNGMLRFGQKVFDNIRNPYDDKTEDGMRKSRWTLRLITFLSYAGLALALIIISSGKNSCYVQNTYKQEFLAKVVANPFYSSSQVYNNGPPSLYEVHGLNKSAQFAQKASDIGIFPVVPLDPANDAAFWPVKHIPSSQIDDARKDLFELPGGAYFFSQGKGDVIAKNVANTKKTGEFIAQAAVQAIHGPLEDGNLMPNIGRCITSKQFASDASSKLSEAGDWTVNVIKVMTNSHLRGTCLLTAQQATVDITSNYKTSLVWFSSVNMLFMLTVVLWISASFALFYTGGLLPEWKKDANDFEEIQTAKPNYNMLNFGSFGKADFAVGLAIAWNVFLIVFVMIPKIQDDYSIPLNNVVIAIFATLAAIAVQWHWALYSGKDHISKQQDGNIGQQQQAAIDEAVIPVAVSQPPEQKSERRQYEENEYYSRSDVYAKFNTHNFLTVATRKMEQQRLITKMANMGYSPLQIQQGLRLGAPIADKHYYRSIKLQMHLDVVQSLEYAITTPILSAALLASFSPTVPTGVVQLLYILMLASQLLCIPVLYLSNLYKRMEKDYAPYTHPNCLRMGVLLLLGACYTLQINAITVKCIFFRQLWDAQYNVDSFLMSTTILMIVVQGFFLLAVFAQSLANITSKGEGSWKATTISRYSLRTYMVLNFLLKFVVGILAFYTARNKAFPAYACGLWANV